MEEALCLEDFLQEKTQKLLLHGLQRKNKHLKNQNGNPTLVFYMLITFKTDFLYFIQRPSYVPISYNVSYASKISSTVLSSS